MGIVVSYEEFITRRFPAKREPSLADTIRKAYKDWKQPDKNLFAEKGTANPSEFLASYDTVLEGIRELGESTMKSLVRAMVVATDTRPDKTMPVSPETYGILLEHGLSGKIAAQTKTESGRETILIDRKDLEALLCKMS